MNRLLFLAFAIYFICLEVTYGQQTVGFSENKLWLRGDSIIQQNSENRTRNKEVLYNYNPVVDIMKEKAVYKNLLDEYFSIFTVFKTNDNSEENVFKLSTRKNKIKVTSTFIDKDEGLEYDKSDPNNGMILSYMTRMKHFSKKNSLSFKDFYKRINEDPENNQLVEVLYFPKILNLLERSKVESYLSIKYGISLIGKKSYITSQNDTIWSYKKNKEFTHNVTGIGRDDEHKLDQKQSGNALNDGLIIGFDTIETSNTKNKTKVSNGFFLVWGNNNAGTELLNNANDTFRKMERVWKVQTSNGLEDLNQQSIELHVNLKDMEMKLPAPGDTPFKLWLAVQDNYKGSFDFETAIIYPSVNTETGIMVFKDIPWEITDKEFRYFTFFAAPAFFAQTKVTATNCVNTTSSLVELKLEGGQAPFNIETTSENGITIHETNDAHFNLNLEAGTHNIIITDALNQVFETSVKLDVQNTPVVEIAPVWQLDANGQVHVLPYVTAHKNLDLTYAWYDSTTKLATTQQFVFRSKGNYEFVVITANGCETRFPIEVIGNNAFDNGSSELFPNPVEINQSFTLSMNLKQPSKVIIRIFNINGQLVASEQLLNRQQITYQNKLSNSGIYFVSVETAQTSRTFKLLVK
ncbi:hypothetical protein A9Q86_15590 [Flavobacteriales bacterium 33_180_T64]|nr:hypothetical protein A9Q86_15590 [Flavobacteriales bacterium 33_180_T64]